MTTLAMPHAKNVREMLTDLLGRDVTVTPAEPLVPGPRDPSMLGVYVDDALRMSAVAVADLPLSAFVGAAIGLIPKGGAEAALEDGGLTAALRDNMAEVLNIMAALFNLTGAAHQRLYTVYTPGELPPTDVSALARSYGRRLDLTVGVAGYGTGRLSIAGA